MAHHHGMNDVRETLCGLRVPQPLAVDLGEGGRRGPENMLRRVHGTQSAEHGLEAWRQAIEGIASV